MCVKFAGKKIGIEDLKLSIEPIVSGLDGVEPVTLKQTFNFIEKLENIRFMSMPEEQFDNALEEIGRLYDFFSKFE